MSTSVVEPGAGWEQWARLCGCGLWGLPGVAFPRWASCILTFPGERVFLPLLQVAEATGRGWRTKREGFSVGCRCFLLGQRGMWGQRSGSF